MGREARAVLEAPHARTFDVICAGEAVWNLSGAGGGFSARSTSLRFRPGGGAVNASLALAQLGVRVGLAAAFGDDTFGRALRERIANAGVDVGGVALTPPRTNLVFVDGFGASRQVVSYREEEQPLAIPSGWSSQVLLLSGLSPALTYGATLCKAARAARRQGTIVVLDANARRHGWSDRDSRAIRAVLREADVARFSSEDMRALHVNEAAVREMMRKNAILVTGTARGEEIATGPFGQIAAAPRSAMELRPTGAGDVFTAAICAELAKAGNTGEHDVALWERALQRGHAAVSARAAKR